MNSIFQQRPFRVLVLLAMAASAIGIQVARRRLLTAYDEFEVGQAGLSQAANSVAVPILLMMLSIFFGLNLWIRREEKFSRLQIAVVMAALCLVAFFVFGNATQLISLLREL